MVRRSSRKRPLAKREPSCSPSPPTVSASSSTAKQEDTDLKMDVKEEAQLPPAKTGKRKRKGDESSDIPPSPKRELRYRKSYVSADMRRSPPDAQRLLLTGVGAGDSVGS